MAKRAGSSGDQKTHFRPRKRASAQKIPFRRTEQPAASSFRRGPAPKIQSEGSTLRAVDTIPSCAAKRVLSLGGGPCSSNKRGTRDWANLEDGPAGLIAELALANDVADYVRFRAVCRPWRQCSPDPRAAGLDARFLPRHWIMLHNASAAPRRRRFFNVCTGECIRMDLPLLADHHTLLALTTEGLLLLLHEPTHTLRLLNPLTLQLTRLPPVTALLRPDQLQAMARGSDLRDTLQVLGASIVAGASVVAVTFSNPMALAVAKPGDETWTAIDHHDRRTITNSLPFRGRLYCASRLGVMVLDIGPGQPRLVMAAEWNRPFYFCPMSASLHLVDNGGELMLVHRKLLCMDYSDEDDHSLDEDDGRQTYSRDYQVYRVDLDAGILIPVKGINRRAVFMGMTRTISVSPEVFPFVTADTIYLGSDCDSEISGYNLVDGSREPWNYGSFYPSRVVECLCRCIEGTGDLLAYSLREFSKKIKH